MLKVASKHKAGALISQAGDNFLRILCVLLKPLVLLATLLLLLLTQSPIHVSAQSGEEARDASGNDSPPIEQLPKAQRNTRFILSTIEPPEELSARDLPNDDGSAIVITWRKQDDLPEGTMYTLYFAEAEEGTYVPLPFYTRPISPDENIMIENLQYFRYRRENAMYQYLIVDLTNFVESAENAYEDALKDWEKRVQLGETLPEPVKKEYDLANLFFKLGVTLQGEVRLFDLPLHAVAVENWFDTSKFNSLIMSLAFLAVLLLLIETAKRKDLYLRRIAGLDAVDEAIGRATEMGRPIFYLCGLDPMTTVSTIAATNLLGHVARHVANYESQLKVPCFDPIVMSVCQEMVREAFYEAGRPDTYNPDNVFFLTNDQFSYVAAVNGMMVRERPAANFFFGYFYAESLLLGEVGQSTGAIQIAGTDANVQIPFFITSCDYTLIGEELYAASAYISREPKLLGSIKASDWAKGLIITVLLLGFLFSVLLLAGQSVNANQPLGFFGEWMEYFLQVFNQHTG